jgi:hypothetical protein
LNYLEGRKLNGGEKRDRGQLVSNLKMIIKEPIDEEEEESNRNGVKK